MNREVACGARWLTARVRQVVPGYSVMGPAKAALEASVRYLAHELVRGFGVCVCVCVVVGAWVTLIAAQGPQDVRVNCISAGPVNTLAARGIPGFRVRSGLRCAVRTMLDGLWWQDMLRAHAERSPLQRNVRPEEVGGAATFLASDWAAAITGQTLHGARAACL